MFNSTAERRSTAIHAYVGPNGGGKSLAMVNDTIASLRGEWVCEHPEHAHTQAGVTRGSRHVLSTVKLLDPETGEPHPQYLPLTEWRQLLEVEHSDILLDEVQGVVSSRQHQSLPPAVLNLLLQLRRRDNALRWTSPSYARADVVLREVTQAVTFCRGHLPEKVEDEARLWGRNRLFYWRTFDALAFDEFTAGKRDDLKPLARELFWRPWNEAHRWYDTDAQVAFISDATEGGTCLMCGGRRRRPRCNCPDDQDEAGGPRTAGVASSASSSSSSVAS